MGKAIDYLQDKIFILIFVVFPLGQILGILTKTALGVDFRLHFLDLLVFMLVCTQIIKSDMSYIHKHIYVFGVLIYSYLISLNFYPFEMMSLLYLIRILVYFALFIYCFSAHFKLNREVLLNCLLISGVLAAFLGILQYLTIPDLTYLKNFGWDDHYFRLVGTFLDPAFTGIIIVLTAHLSFYKFKLGKNKLYLLVALFLLLCLAATFSRSSFLALTVGLIILYRDNIKTFISIGAILLLFIAILPKQMGGEGVNLGRTSSIMQKAENYKSSINIFFDNPLFGVGIGNLCEAKARQGDNVYLQKNSCFGADNSILYLAASAGIVGLISFTYLISIANGVLIQSTIYTLWQASLVSVFIHGMFTNTFFYPWVMIWICLLTISTRLGSKM